MIDMPAERHTWLRSLCRSKCFTHSKAYVVNDIVCKSALTYVLLIEMLSVL